MRRCPIKLPSISLPEVEIKKNEIFCVFFKILLNIMLTPVNWRGIFTVFQP